MFNGIDLLETGHMSRAFLYLTVMMSLYFAPVTRATVKDIVVLDRSPFWLSYLNAI